MVSCTKVFNCLIEVNTFYILVAIIFCIEYTCDVMCSPGSTSLSDLVLLFGTVWTVITLSHTTT